MSFIEQLAQNLTATLVAINDPKSSVQQRNAANQQLQKWGEENRGLFMLALAAELANEEKPPTSRQLAGIMLKNVLHSKEADRAKDLAQKWLTLDQDIRNKIKQAATMTFSSPVREARIEAANVVAKIAIVELPLNLWPGLIEALIENMKSPNPFLRQSTVTTLGYLCEAFDPSSLNKALADQILTAVVHGMIPEEQNDDVKLAACNALYYSLEFARNNFEVEEERRVIMNVILDACTHPNSKIRIAAYEILVKVASRYYEYLAPSMQRIFTLTLQAIRTDQELVAQQAIEFWSTICDEELIILDEAEEAKQYNQPPPRECHYFIKGAVNYLVPVLTEAMTKGDKSTDAQQWNIAMAAGSCLNLIANTIGDDVVAPTMNFVKTHWNSQDLRYKESAIFAFGSIMDGATDAIRPLITEAIPSLIQLLTHPSIEIKDTTAWTISKICQFHPSSIGPHLPLLVNAVAESLKDDPRVSSHACWAIVNLTQAFQSNPNNSPFNAHFTELIKLLLHTASRDDASEAQLALQAYEAINALISSAGDTNLLEIEKLIPYFLDQLDSLLRTKSNDDSERQENEDLQGLLCGTLMVITQKLGEGIGNYADKMMSAYLKVIHGTMNHPDPSTNYVHEDALMAIGSLANVLGPHFEKHMKDFHQILYAALTNWQDYQVCNIAVGVVGDVARAIGIKLIPYSEKLVSLLLSNVQNPNLDKSVKPSILSCFGDIALAVCGYFEKWVPIVMNMLQQASTMATSIRLDQTDDLDLIDYFNQLREGIFEAYTGIIQGLRTDRKADILLPYVPTMMGLVSFVWADQLKNGNITRSAIGLLGDLAHSLGPKIRQYLEQDFVRLLINSAIQDPNQLTQSVAFWAKDMITKALS
jgi:importin subunit beta-1